MYISMSSHSSVEIRIPVSCLANVCLNLIQYTWRSIFAYNDVFIRCRFSEKLLYVDGLKTRFSSLEKGKQYVISRQQFNLEVSTNESQKCYKTLYRHDRQWLQGKIFLSICTHLDPKSEKAPLALHGFVIFETKHTASNRGW